MSVPRKALGRLVPPMPTVRIQKAVTLVLVSPGTRVMAFRVMISMSVTHLNLVIQLLVFAPIRLGAILAPVRQDTQGMGSLLAMTSMSVLHLARASVPRMPFVPIRKAATLVLVRNTILEMALLVTR